MPGKQPASQPVWLLIIISMQHSQFYGKIAFKNSNLHAEKKCYSKHFNWENLWFYECMKPFIRITLLSVLNYLIELSCSHGNFIILFDTSSFLLMNTRNIFNSWFYEFMKPFIRITLLSILNYLVELSCSHGNFVILVDTSSLIFLFVVKLFAVKFC